MLDLDVPRKLKISGGCYGWAEAYNVCLSCQENGGSHFNVFEDENHLTNITDPDSRGQWERGSSQAEQTYR